MEVIVCHWDGYALNRNNFRIYHDRAAGKLVFLPHGLDQNISAAKHSSAPDDGGAVAKGVLEIPEVAERYRARQLVFIDQRFFGASRSRCTFPNSPRT
jgi:hypothetical protein